MLWHQKTTHIAGHNRSTAVIRQAMIHDFIKTSRAIPDERLLDISSNDMWEDWSEELRRAAEAEHGLAHARRGEPARL